MYLLANVPGVARGIKNKKVLKQIKLKKLPKGGFPKTISANSVWPFAQLQLYNIDKRQFDE